MGCYPGKVKTRNKNISVDNSQLLDILYVENNNLGVN